MAAAVAAAATGVVEGSEGRRDLAPKAVPARKIDSSSASAGGPGNAEYFDP